MRTSQVVLSSVRVEREKRICAKRLGTAAPATVSSRARILSAMEVNMGIQSLRVLHCIYLLTEEQGAFCVPNTSPTPVFVVPFSAIVSV